MTWLDRKALPAEAPQAILLGDFVIVATGLLTAVLDRLSIPSQERQCETGRQATRTQVIQEVKLALQTYVGPAGLEYPIAALLAQATTRYLTHSDTRAAPP